MALRSSLNLLQLYLSSSSLLCCSYEEDNSFFRPSSLLQHPWGKIGLLCVFGHGGRRDEVKSLKQGEEEQIGRRWKRTGEAVVYPIDLLPKSPSDFVFRGHSLRIKLPYGVSPKSVRSGWLSFLFARGPRKQVKSIDC